MANNDFMVALSPTTNNHSLGLFAMDDYEKDDILCYYYGEIVDTELATSNNYHSDYVLRYNAKYSVDAAKEFNCLARYINDGIYSKKINAKFTKIKDEVKFKVVATKPIKSGDEILVSYGVSYWLDSEHAEALPAKEQRYLMKKYPEFKAFIENNYS